MTPIRLWLRDLFKPADPWTAQGITRDEWDKVIRWRKQILIEENLQRAKEELKRAQQGHLT